MQALERVRYAPVAQLDRVTGYEPVGQGFESLTARQTKIRSRKWADFRLYYCNRKPPAVLGSSKKL